MALILNIETSTENCSVALARDGEIVSGKEVHSDKYIHSESLHPFIDEVLKEVGVSLNELDAIAVGKGPGSYTGLRIGVSAAKGLAYPLGIPLISSTSLDILAADFTTSNKSGPDDLIVPMIDARRMEVYTAIYSHKGTPISMIEARIVEEGGLDHLQAEQVYVFGTGAKKCEAVLKHPKFRFVGPVFPSALALAQISEKKFLDAKFEDIAYFEPFYLKEFIAGKAKPYF
jgi:tRNA threonylcarbamoyladenosine biosynthesis protein TsaB